MAPTPVVELSPPSPMHSMSPLRGARGRPHVLGTHLEAKVGIRRVLWRFGKIRLTWSAPRSIVQSANMSFLSSR